MARPSLDTYSSLLQNKSQSILSLSSEFNEYTSIFDDLSIPIEDKDFQELEDTILKSASQYDLLDACIVQVNTKLQDLLTKYRAPASIKKPSVK